MPPAGCRALVALDAPYLERDGKRFRVSAGMLVSAEVNLGSGTVDGTSALAGAEGHARSRKGDVNTVITPAKAELHCKL